MEKIHYKTATLSVKKLIESMPTNKFTIVNCKYRGAFYVSFDSGEAVTIVPEYKKDELEKIVYFNGNSYCELSCKHEIARKMLLAIHHVLLNSTEEKSSDEFLFWDKWNAWCRYTCRGYARFFHTPKDILDA